MELLENKNRKFFFSAKCSRRERFAEKKEKN
jgi:hypothetical protein